MIHTLTEIVKDIALLLTQISQAFANIRKSFISSEADFLLPFHFVFSSVFLKQVPRCFIV